MTNSDADCVDCESNITEAGRRRRLIFGLAWIGVGGASALLLRLAHVPRPARLVLFVPFAAGTISVFQAFLRT